MFLYEYIQSRGIIIILAAYSFVTLIIVVIVVLKSDLSGVNPKVTNHDWSEQSKQLCYEVISKWSPTQVRP
jgi:hypothetical protein